MTQFVIGLIAAGGYWGIALLMCLENVFPPIPSEVIMGLGGIAVAQGRMAPVPLMIAGTAGSVAGNYFWYAVGRALGTRRLKPLIDRWGRWLTLEWDDIERLERFFDRWGGLTVFGFRVMPSFRTLISLPAGLLRMPRWKFLLWTAAGTALWNAVLVGAGYFLGSRFEALDAILGPLAVAIMVLLAGGYLWRVLTRSRRAR